MKRHSQLVNAKYDALMFAKSPDDARRAARELVIAVLGESAAAMPLDEALRESCRELRPSEDPKEQARFEAEFVELGIWPNTPQRAAA